MSNIRSRQWVLRILPAVFLGSVVLGCTSVSNPLDETLSLDLNGADVREVISSLATSAGLKPVLDPDLGGKVSLSLDEVSVRSALDEVCELAACTWEVERIGNSLTVQTTKRIPIPTGAERFDLVIEEGVALDVLQPLADVLDAELVVQPELEGRLVTLDLTAATASEALDEVCRLLACSWRLDTEAGGARLFVEPAQ